MLYYKSSIGCIEYYDEVENKPLLCDPTMLFILGLEAITTPQEEYYKEIQVIDPDTHKSVIDRDTGLPVSETILDVVRLRRVVIYKDRINDENVYDKIVKYFSVHGNPEEFEDRVEFYCAGLRQFMNQLTGTDSSRIIPIIFHDIIEFSTLGVEDKSDYNEIYEKITNVLSSAGCKNQVYKKLDNESMYSYALGVLYGCWRLGFSNNDVFASDPINWYHGEYSNLVRTAHLIFSFHYKHSICCVDSDPRLFIKYKGIPTNKIWNLHSQGSDDMADRLFYIDGSWLTYEQAHSLGYSVLPQRLVTFYTVNNVSVVIKQDSGDNTYYDSENRRWVADFADLNLYKKVKSNILFRGESSEEYSCYTSSVNDKSYTHILYNSLIRSTNYTYENYGITAYPCENIIAYDSDSPIIWFDASTNKYFDDRDDIHRWVDSLSDIKVTLYDSLLNTEKEIYEDATNNRFFYDNTFVSRDDFYSHDNYGIIRETIFLFKDSLSYKTYHDSYSDEYCIPNITDIWVRKEDLIGLGYSFIGGTGDLWLGDDLSRLPWK